MVTSVWVVDGRELFRRGVADALRSEIGPQLDVGSARDGAEARARMQVATPDVAVIGDHLADDSPAALCRWLREHVERTRTLLVAARIDKPTLLAAIDAGASGLLPEDASATEMAHAVAQLAGQRSMLGPHVIQRLLSRMPVDTVPRAQLESLTRRQRDILLLVSGGRSNREIASELGIAEQTVKNNVSRLLAQLGCERRTQLVAIGAAITR